MNAQMINSITIFKSNGIIQILSVFTIYSNCIKLAEVSSTNLVFFTHFVWYIIQLSLNIVRKINWNSVRLHNLKYIRLRIIDMTYNLTDRSFWRLLLISKVRYIHNNNTACNCISRSMLWNINVICYLLVIRNNEAIIITPLIYT